MSLCRNFRVFGLTLCWLCLLLLPASAQWLFEKKPSAEGSAFQMARHAPAEAEVMIGFHLLGQVDVLGVWADIRDAAQVLKPDTRAELMGFDEELGVPLEEWLGYFTGSGYLALLGRQLDEDWSESLVLAVQLQQPSLFDKWLVSKLGGDLPQRKVGDFVIRQISDDTQFGTGQGWFFIASNDLMASRTVAALSHTEKTLDSEAGFVRAQSSLAGGQSGLFVYLHGQGVRQNVLDLMDLPQDPAADRLAFWDFAVVSVDFSNQQVDAFVAYPEGKGAVSSALLSPGGVDASLLNLMPSGISTVAAGDLGWFSGVADAVGEEVPELAMMLAIAKGQLGSYGDLGEVFTGTVVVASNLVEVLGQMFRANMEGKSETEASEDGTDEESDPSVVVAAPVKDVAAAHDLALRLSQVAKTNEADACAENLSELSSLLDGYTADHDGRYPSSLSELIPDYIDEIPACPAAGEDTYSKGYRVIENDGEMGFQHASFYCQGHYHPELEPDKPAFSTQDGLVMGPVTPKPTADKNDVAPSKGQQRRYQTAFGPTLVLDGSQSALRLIYGPQAEEFLAQNSAVLGEHPMVGRALAWGDHSVIYLDYLNLQPFYDVMLEVTQVESKKGDSEAIFFEKLLRKSRARIGSLEGVSCWKASPDGLHYRSSGLGSGQFMLAVAVGAMVGSSESSADPPASDSEEELPED